jgi:hypothetical protein
MPGRGVARGDRSFKRGARRAIVTPGARWREPPRRAVVGMAMPAPSRWRAALAYRRAVMHACPSSRPRTPQRATGLALLLLPFVLGAFAAAVRGQPRAVTASIASRTGLELALSGPSQVVAGHVARLHGTAYEVRGLATLRALPGAEVRARYATDAADATTQPFSRVIAGADGRFALEVPIPAAAATSRLDVEVAHGDTVRAFDSALSVSPAITVDAFADRALYEPGETARIWVRALDTVSRAPLAGVAVRVEVSGGLRAPAQLVTGASGVAVAEIAIPASFGAGQVLARVVIARRGEPPVARMLDFAVARRVVERMRVDTEIAPEAPAPGAPLTITVRARTSSGAPLRGAVVAITMPGAEPLTTTTSRDGVARLETRATAYLADATDRVALTVRVTHAAHGTRTIETSFALAPPRTLVLSATGPAGGLVPEVPQTLWITLLDAAGEPPETPQTVHVAGPAVRGGTFTGTTDAHGLLAVPARVPSGAAARHVGDSACSGRVATSVDVTVDGEVQRVARLCVPVAQDALVGVRAETPAATPGGSLAVTITRRPAVADRAVIVELRSLRYDAPGVLASHVLSQGETRAVLTLPAGHLGPTLVRARPLDVPGASEGAGGLDAILVQPARPVFATLSLDRAVYPVRGEAQLTVRTAPGGPRAWVAVLARDLAMHAGEAPFRRTFLDAEFDRALLDPDAREAQDLLRVTLAAGVEADLTPSRAEPLVDALGAPIAVADPLTPETTRGDLRDPIAAADELARRGVAPLMRAAEEALAEALEGDAGDDDPLDTITEGTRRSRRFRDALLTERLGDGARTLGDGVATTSMLGAIDPSFTYESVARRVARRRLVTLLAALARYLEPGPDEPDAPRAEPGEPVDRWLSRMTQRGILRASALRDPWGGHFALRRSARPALVVARAAEGWELASPGPDGVAGSADDVRDPFARAVPAGTPWAVASGEDALMETLGTLAPGAATLRAIADAYARLTEAAEEEERGDAVVAGASEFDDAEGDARTVGLASLGTRGYGAGGGGSGMGYGSGSGRLGRRSSQNPRVRSGSAQITAGGGLGALSGLLRRRFPATLALRGDVPIAPDGETRVTLPLADATTTYVVEAVLWDEAGWTWSASTELRVERDVVVEAPIPPFAVAGDRLRIPVRVGNRTAADVAVRVSLGDADRTESASITVPAGDVRATPLALALDRPGAREVTLQLATESGALVDAVAHPLTVHADARPVRATGEALGRGAVALALTVPAGATRLGASTVRVETGDALFAQTGVTSDVNAWGRALLGHGDDPRLVDGLLAQLESATNAPGRDRAQGTTLARTLGALWASRALSDEAARAALDALSTQIPTEARDAGDTTHDATDDTATVAEMLLGLAPAARAPAARPALQSALAHLVTSLRARVEREAAALSDTPELLALSAAAITLAAPADTPTPARAQELRRRARRGVLRLGDDAWLAPSLVVDAVNGPRRASALLAIAEAIGGDRDLAFALLRGLRSADERTRPTAYAGTRIVGADPTLARVAASLLASEGRTDNAASSRAVTLRIDGHARQLTLREGAATLDAPELARPGRHRVEVIDPAGAVLLARATLRYGVPWERTPTTASGLALSLDELPAAQGARGGFTLVVRNRAPRLIAAPIVEVLLPAGAELDTEAARALAPALVADPELEGRTLRLQLRALPPGGAARLPLALRFTVTGTLHGLGVVARALDAPGRVSVLPPRALTLADGDAR